MMKKKVFSLFLALLMSLLTCVPAFAVEEKQLSMDVANPMAVGLRTGGPQTTAYRPPIPSGFYTIPYTIVESNTLVDFICDFTSSGIVAYIFSPLGGAAFAVAGAIAAALQGIGGGELPAGAVEYIYEAKNPVTDYQVPYVFWHLIKYTVEVDDGQPIVFYTNYYEFAVMPRSTFEEVTG